MTEHTYSLPGLVYHLDDLEPTLSNHVMDVHYREHHQAYINDLNNALRAQAEALASNNLVRQLELQQIIKFNAGAHINHTLFWESLLPSYPDTTSIESLDEFAPNLRRSLTEEYGSLAVFRTEFEMAALALQGSGWVWLVKEKPTNLQQLDDIRLSIITTKDEDLVPADKIPLLGVDMWEHAYYWQYGNNKKGYLKNIWDVINWSTVERRSKKDESEEVYGELFRLAARFG